MLWSKVFDCPRTCEETDIRPEERYQEYLVSPEEMKLNGYPSEGIPEFMQFENTDLWEAKNNNYQFGKILCLDCEMVETQHGYELAKISIVDFEFKIVYESFCKPDYKITNYHTRVSGITEDHLRFVDKSVNEIQTDL